MECFSALLPIGVLLVAVPFFALLAVVPVLGLRDRDPSDAKRALAKLRALSRPAPTRNPGWRVVQVLLTAGQALHDPALPPADGAVDSPGRPTGPRARRSGCTGIRSGESPQGLPGQEGSKSVLHPVPSGRGGRRRCRRHRGTTSRGQYALTADHGRCGSRVDVVAHVVP